MKKFLLAVVALGSVMTANAQNGTWLLYGNVGLNSAKDAEKNTTFNWNLNPGVGYQFNNNWTVGVNLGWGEGSYKANGSSDKTTVNSYELGLFGRYTKDINDMFYLYGQLDAGYQGGYTTHASDPSFDKHTGFMGDLYPAVGLHVTHCIGINFGIGGISYMTDKQTDNGGVKISNPNTASSFALTFGRQFNVGISANIGGHHMHHGKKGESKSKSEKNDSDDDE